MLVVYAIPPSLYCAKLRITLRHKELVWREEPPPGGYGSDAYKEIVPSGNLPALLDGDLLIADSEAIAEYLNEAYPTPPMLPADPAARAKARERGRFHDTRLEPAVRALFPYLPPKDVPAMMAAAQSQTLSDRLAQLASMLSADTDAGTDLTLGDCGFPITFTWMEVLTPLLGLTIDWPTDIAAYRERLETHVAVGQELLSYRPVVSGFLAQ
ncbi:MAG: glutathione S-transferase family protein [Pseudomonadota bacterium]